jgi:hypothetical protein
MAEVEAAAAGGAGSTDGATNALAASIAARGSNSYYYAHHANLLGPERAVVYDEPPRLVSVTPAPAAAASPVVTVPIHT